MMINAAPTVYVSYVCICVCSIHSDVYPIHTQCWVFESPSSRDIFCLKYFVTFTETSACVSKMNVVARTQLA